MQIWPSWDCSFYQYKVLYQISNLQRVCWKKRLHFTIVDVTRISVDRIAPLDCPQFLKEDNISRYWNQQPAIAIHANIWRKASKQQVFLFGILMGSEVVLIFWQAHYFRSAIRSKGIDSPYYIPLLSLFSIGQEQLSSVSCKRSDNESQIQPDIAERWAHLGASQNTSVYRSSWIRSRYLSSRMVAHRI